jgi:methylase of polypeptide subunit release factors
VTLTETDSALDGRPVADLSTPWSAVGARWGHSWHKMCSYLGTYPPSLARAAVALFSDPGDIVLDPFSGRGTTLLEARLTGRRAYASDLNPIALALSQAKAKSVSYETALQRIEELRESYDRVLYMPEGQVQPDDIQIVFHPATLAQLCYLRNVLVDSPIPGDAFLLGCLLGVMHGAERQDGTSGYASISMPNTFSMSPNYVRKFVVEKGLNRVERDVFGLLISKVERMTVDGAPGGFAACVAACDAKSIATCQEFQPIKGKVDLIVTSPPYLDVVNYAKQNWIRNWLLNAGRTGHLALQLDDDLNLAEWMSFSTTVLNQMAQLLTDDGVIVFVVGDVARAGMGSISLARELIRRIAHDGQFGFVGCLDDKIADEVKTTRIWGETKGKATQIDRFVVLSRTEPVIRVDQLDSAFPGIILSQEHKRFLAAPYLAEYAKRFSGI